MFSGLKSYFVNLQCLLHIYHARHCVESVQKRSYFWSVFSYGVNLCIQYEFRKIRTRNNSVFGHFSRSESWSRNIPKNQTHLVWMHVKPCPNIKTGHWKMFDTIKMVKTNFTSPLQRYIISGIVHFISFI